MQQRAQATQQKILHAGIEEFAQHGYHGAKIDRIADQAGINKQRIYAYFKNKQGLFNASISSCFDRLLQYEDVLLRLQQDQSEQLAERVLRHYMAFHEQTPQFWRLVAWCNLEQVDLELHMSRIDSSVFEHLKNIYLHGREQGHYPKAVSFEAFMFTLTSLSFFYFSNMKTMSKSLQIDLRQDLIRERLITEILKLCHLHGDHA